MNSLIIQKKLTIIAGPCSIEQNNIDDILKIAKISVTNRFGRKQKAIVGTRVVGLKSRTALNKDGKNMGIDFHVFMENLDRLVDSQAIVKLKTLPSIKIAAEIIKETGMIVATEVMSPLVQLPLFEKKIFKNKLLVWNPAVNQLGWPVLKMGKFAKRNGWYIGLKNGKWLGDDFHGQSTMEKTWIGLTKFTGFDEPGLDEKLILIHRGVDVANKGDYRSLPVHHVAKNAKLATRAKLFFDPSHSYGSHLRDSIVKGTIEAMKIKIDEDNFLYDGILIEAGHARTDTEQHITIKELQFMCNELVKFRDLVAPE